jgi:hypothetical protein
MRLADILFIDRRPDLRFERRSDRRPDRRRLESLFGLPPFSKIFNCFLAFSAVIGPFEKYLYLLPEPGDPEVRTRYPPLDFTIVYGICLCIFTVSKKLSGNKNRIIYDLNIELKQKTQIEKP